MTATTNIQDQLAELTNRMDGELLVDELHRRLFSTDASVYQERPLGVAFPRTSKDLQQLVSFGWTNKVAMIPRAGGTSLAGQCVGAGLVVDVSRHLNKIVSFNETARTVTVQPGLVRDELNYFLKPYGLQFAPITSTANRATIGGMVGNNSCGTNSIVYGDTRRYVRNIRGFLSDGSPVTIEALNEDELSKRRKLNSLEGKIYQQLHELLADPVALQDIRANFPKATVTRRNTGYALDALIGQHPYGNDTETFSLAPLIAGSEGTLLMMSEITLDLVPLPPPVDVVLLAHFESIQAAMQAVTVVMEQQPYACELMDRTILDCTRGNLKYQKTLAHFQGDPAAVLMVEFRAGDVSTATLSAKKLQQQLERENHGYAYPLIIGSATRDIWGLRSAGLGLLANIPGDDKGVACIEDTAVAIEDLADYMAEFAELMQGFQQDVIYYAHAGAGEIHLRPILNLKKSDDRQKFHDITLAVARLVKKYRGSLSGEHGDGRVRAPFIPLVVGHDNYRRFQSIKHFFDPKNILNPGKVVDPSPMNEQLRFNAGQTTPDYATILDFFSTGGLLRMAEKCNGSGDCRKLPLSGGTMCPSYHATREERHTTRGRANLLRQLLTESEGKNAFDRQELKEVLDLCVSCKGCTAECPSNVDMASLKAEFLHQYYRSNPIPLRARLFARINDLNRLGGLWPGLTNWLLSSSLTSGVIKRFLGVAPQRSLPTLHSTTLRQWFKKDFQSTKSEASKRAEPVQKLKVSKSEERASIFLFCDEFTNHNDVVIGQKAVRLLDRLGYDVELVDHPESGRAAISKGLLKHARRVATENVKIFSPLISEDRPLIGIEPSAILGFRDEYPRLVEQDWREAASDLAKRCFTIEEFLVREIRQFRLTSEMFDHQERHLLVHGHCHQKALTEFKDVFALLSLPANHKVNLLDTGCCGMAGSFGYEAEHYEVSMQMGELRLFPVVRAAPQGAVIVAAGTSCRHQIMDGTAVRAVHPVEVLLDALL
ncbi:FAD-binding oxidoreductase [Lewinellaceae bacterium SD302]|nr:FAD-binding oxidoreductase [Lewinellaceae bacterium SD302]